MRLYNVKAEHPGFDRTTLYPKEIVAFLNTDGGTIYIGINDDGTVCGKVKK